MEKKLYELTNPQKSIWYTEEFYKETPINNICGSFIIKQNTDLDLLNKAINCFIQNNDSFKLRFKRENNNLYQYFCDDEFFKFEILDINTENQIEVFAKKQVNICFDILKSKPFDFKLFKLKNGFGGFIVICHHIISDAATFSLIAQEVAQNYINLTNNVPIPEKKYSYLDYINSEKEYMKSQRFEKDKSFWKEQLADNPEVATIPILNELNIKTSYSSNRKEFILKKDLLDKIKTFCKESNISLYNFFIAVYSFYLGKINNMDCFTVGTPVLNRSTVEQKNCSGMFISTSLLKINVNKENTFMEYVKSITKTCMQTLKHQKYNYQYILSDMRKEKNTTKNLYDIVFSYQITKARNSSLSIPYSTNWYGTNYIANTLNVHFHDNNNTGNLFVEYDYQTSKLSENDIFHIHNRILHILNQVLDNNNLILQNITITPKDEEMKILYSLENTNATYPSDKTIIDLFEQQVKLTPNNIALKFKNKTLTYDELNKHSNRLAKCLLNHGVQHNDIIALRINKSLEMIIGILAILKAGACYLPIDLSYPEERVNFMLRDSNAKLLLTNSLHQNDIDIHINTFAIDSSTINLETYSDNNFKRATSPDDLIYIIYTSGSTGTPKGVMLTNRNVVRLLKNDKFQFDFNEHDIWTMFHSVAFDFSVWEMYGALLYGGKLILVDEKTSKNPDLFLKLLQDEKVTILNQTPTYFYNLQERELLKDESNLSIRYIIYGGEALNPSLIKPWKDKYPYVKLINMYGITETTVHVTYKELTEENLLSSSSNIGKPIPTLKVYIMDENQNLLPYGVEGEMHVSGLGVCRGYLNRPELNTSRFIKNPYNKNEILYRSADNAILMEDGNLYYKGRIDNQVKIRGYRIELGEIETKLLSNPHIIKSIVLPKKIGEKDSFLVAYLVTDNQITVPKIKKYITPLLPTYMIPTFFVLLDKIPLTNNGKVDRNALLNLKIENKNLNTYVKPRNLFETEFSKVLENILDIDKIGIDDNILDIGADSLTLMSVTIELLKKGFIVNIQDIYEHKTIRNINDNIQNLNNQNSQDNRLSDNIFYNFEENFHDSKIQIKNILLTGCTGYLGIHILANLLRETDATIYCLIRYKNKQPAKNRLLKKLKYYFGNEILNYIDTRIKVVTSDITMPNLGLSNSKYESLGNKIDVVIHCAALVSHYGNQDLFTQTNVYGTNNIITFCKKFSIRLNHISTISISADFCNNTSSLNSFDEHSLYIGQNYSSNIYIKTKFEAELNIQKAIQEGLIASVYRLGNITARISDGKFQENNNENAFLNRLIAFSQLHKLPESYSKLVVDLSPVDECSKFITSILKYESSYSKVFHIYNNNKVKISDIIEKLNSSGLNIEVVSDSDFNKFISTYEASDEILGIVNDLTSNSHLAIDTINVKSDFTLNYMKKIGLKWTPTTKNYMDMFLIKYLKKDGK